MTKRSRQPFLNHLTGRDSGGRCRSLRLERGGAEGNPTRKSRAPEVVLHGRVPRGAEKPRRLPG